MTKTYFIVDLFVCNFPSSVSAHNLSYFMSVHFVAVIPTVLQIYNTINSYSRFMKYLVNVISTVSQAWDVIQKI